MSAALDAAWQACMAAFAAHPENEPVLDGLVAALAESFDGQMMGRQTWADDPGASIVGTAWACLELISQALLRPHAGGNNS